MNTTFQLWIESRVWPWLGDFAWRGSALLAITLVALGFLQRRSAASRHGLLVTGILSTGFLLALSGPMPVWHLKSRPEAPLERHQAGTSAVSHALATERYTAAAPPAVPHEPNTIADSVPPPLHGQPSGVSGEDHRFALPSLAILGWLSGTFGGGLLLLISMMQLRSLRLRAQPATDATLVEALHRACLEAGMRRERVRLFTASRGVMPMMWGWRHITILLPAEAMEWSRERLDLVLRHEVAHARRGDAASSLACWICLLPLWWHPLAWASLRLLSRLREEACDERVLSGLSRRRKESYAATLVQVIAAAGDSPRRAWLPALAMASTQARTLRARLEAIMDEGRDRRPFSTHGRACAAAAASVLTIGLSMLSACRESPTSTVGPPEKDGSRTYFLTDKQWKMLTAPADGDSAPTTAPNQEPAVATRSWGGHNEEKMRRIVLPEVNLNEASLDEAVEFLRSKSRECDVAEKDPARKGINLVIKPGAPVPKGKITMNLKNVPLLEALRYVTELVGMTYLIEPFAVLVAAAPVPSKSHVTTPDLRQAALRIRTHLVEAGVTFTEAPDGEVVVLKDERTLQVWTDEAGHQKLASVLARFGKDKMLRITMHAFAVPMESHWISDLGVMSLAQGVPTVTAALSAEQTADLLQRLQQDKSCSLFAAPTVVTPEGRRATIENIREFIYPTEFDPPKVLPRSPLPDDSKGGTTAPTSYSVTPTTPTAFEMRPVGLRLEIDPEVSMADDIITLALEPEWTVFEGFLDYGQPIYASTTDAVGKATPVELTANKLKQPIFRTATLRTSVTMHDGTSVVMGGMGEPLGADIAKPEISAKSPGEPDKRPTGPFVTYGLPPGTQGNAEGDVNPRQLPPISQVNRAIFFLIQAKIVE